MTDEKKLALLAEFGDIEGAKIVAETEQIEEHCRIHGITEHSINENGSCNMGCC